MRDPERLDNFYNEIKEIHKNNYPDWRIGQFFNNFLAWHCNKYGDFFYVEDAKFVERFNEYINSLKGKE